VNLSLVKTMEEARRRHRMDTLEFGNAPGLVVLGVFLGLGYLMTLWGQRFLFETIHPFFSAMILVLFAAVGFASLRMGLKRGADKDVVFLKNPNYRKALLQSSKDIVSLADQQTLSEKIVMTLVQIFDAKFATLFLLDEAKSVYQLRVSMGSDKDSKNLSLTSDDPLIQTLSREAQILTDEGLEYYSAQEDKAVLLRKMKLLSAKVILPLVLRERLVGLCAIGPKSGNGPYTQGDLELLSILGNQASVALENARLYENLKQSQNIIRRADRLSSLGVLTAGLAHEIRNPLVAIRTFTQLLPERYQDREFREEFQVIALREVDRICGLVNDLLSFARPSIHNVSSENINEVVENIARILETQAKERGVQISRELAPDLPKIWIDKEQLKQVFMNIILNAIQSIEGSGVVEVSTRLFKKDSSERFVQIGIRDSGVGIPEQDLENIFNPFFTTKKDGSGLGLSISHQIVQEHGGYMLVESRPGEGTTFLIQLAIKPFNP